MITWKHLIIIVVFLYWNADSQPSSGSHSRDDFSKARIFTFLVLGKECSNGITFDYLYDAKNIKNKISKV